MKKLAYFAFALTLTVFVACKSKQADSTDGTGNDTTAVKVETGASDQLDNKAKVDKVLNQSSDDELFGTDVDDSEVENATKK